MDGDNLVDASSEFEIATLKNQIEKLKNELTKYKVLLKEVDSEADPNVVSDEEVICIQQIAKLKEHSAKRDLSTDEVKKLDILHKNLKLARGEDARIASRSKAGKMTAEQLANIAKS